jgi:hypothetical protein
VIEMPLVRQACALVADVQASQPKDYMPRLKAWAREEPEQVAELCGLLARLVEDPELVDSETMLEHLDSIGVDLTDLAREAHRLYWHYKKNDQRYVPLAIRSGERIYQRKKKARLTRERAIRSTTKGVA